MRRVKNKRKKEFMDLLINYSLLYILLMVPIYRRHAAEIGRSETGAIIAQVTTQVSLFQEFFMSLNRIKSLPLIIFCAAAVAFPFAYFISAYTYSYSALSGDLSYDPNVSTKIYDVNGEIISELFDENRTLTETGVIPPVVKQAFLTAEDKNFYLHSGFYLPGIVRAVLVDMFSGDIRQGGSTITQQLVKQLYTKGEKTIRRKLIEILLAREFEKKYTKEQILEMYLSQIYFGHGVYGVSSAARFFFDKDLNRSHRG